jgi:hypothetical protein
MTAAVDRIDHVREVRLAAGALGRSELRMGFLSCAIYGIARVQHGGVRFATLPVVNCFTDGVSHVHARYAYDGLTRSRRENPAFNYGFFRPNPLIFGWVAWKNEEHAP